MESTIEKIPYYLTSSARNSMVSPSDYVPPPFGSDSGKISIHSTLKKPEIAITPSPGDYDDPRCFKPDLSKGFIHNKQGDKSPVQNPGPCEYSFPNDTLNDVSPIKIKSKREIGRAHV